MWQFTPRSQLGSQKGATLNFKIEYYEYMTFGKIGGFGKGYFSH